MEEKVNPLRAAYQKLDRIREEQHEVNERSIAIRNEERRLRREEIAALQEIRKMYLGTAWETDKMMFAVYDVPQINETMTGPNFNEYQLPAYVIHKDERGWEALDKDTVFLGYITGRNLHLKEEPAEAIPLEKFIDAWKFHIQQSLLDLSNAAELRRGYD